MAASSSRPSLSVSKEMLAIPVKKTEPVDLYGSPPQVHRLQIPGSQAQGAEGVLRTINKCRSDMERDDLPLPTRYFKCLCMMESIYPPSPAQAQAQAYVNDLAFVWYDAFKPQQKSSQHNIHLEKAAVLFNLGAVCSQIRLSCDRNTVHGHCLALDPFRAASDWFYKLWINESVKASFGGSTTVDVKLKFENELTGGSSPSVSLVRHSGCAAFSESL